jgi:hypothetical protein
MLAHAGDPSVGRIVAAAPDADLVVIAGWTWFADEMPTPPPPPERYSVERISNGSVVASMTCDRGPDDIPMPCDWRKLLQGQPWANASFSAGSPAQARAARVRHVWKNEWALEVKTRKGFVRALWIIGEELTITRQWRTEAGLLLAVSELYGLRQLPSERQFPVFLTARELEHPKAPERQARILDMARHLVSTGEMSAGAGWYRTAAELGPLPADHLLPALHAAEFVRREDLGARWFQRATRSMKDEDVNRLRQEIVSDSTLRRVAAKLGLGKKGCGSQPRSPCRGDAQP